MAVASIRGVQSFVKAVSTGSFAKAARELDVSPVAVSKNIARLEREHPALQGWILDERGRIRRHINVFVNGEKGGEDTAIAPDDRVDVLPAISGGCW